jgi:trehalose/maltose hydrolase-like predicted phosphorylase
MTMWLWTYEGWDPDQQGQREALCTLGNGYLATRGALAECEADGTNYPGTYLAGVYNRLTDEVAGQSVVNESLVNVPNWMVLRLRAEGSEWFSPMTCRVLSHRTELNMQRGVLTRRSRLEDPDGRILAVTQRRFVSLRDPHLMALEATVVPVNFSGRLEILTAIDGRVRNTGVERYAALSGDHLRHVHSRACTGETVCLLVRTSDSHIAIAESARVRVWVDGALQTTEGAVEQDDRWIGRTHVVEANRGGEVRVEKVVGVYTSLDPGIYAPQDAACHTASTAGDFDDLLDNHVTSWGHAWERSRIDLTGEVGHTERVLNLHVFHLLQTVSKHNTDVDAGVPARGLHGEAYRGHVFWDELFILPFLTYRVPELTRTLLRYRARRLDRAREAARAAGFEGAMYPWQSASDGTETTQSLHLNPTSGRWLPDASRLQRHINAAIAWNVWHYWQVTTDLEFLRFWGAEMLLEIARFWASTATYNHVLDRWEILRVVGPDEYHEGYPGADEPGLDNNAYTNVMAVWCLQRALDALEALSSSRRHELIEKLHLSREELDRWRDLTRKMRLCFHGDHILSQFEGWDDLAELDWDAYRARYGNIGRLDRILEAEGDSPNNYKLSKQADTLMLLYLLSPQELGEILERLGYEFDPRFVQRNLAYYEQRTSHGSTLSTVVHAWLHSRHGRGDSWELFRQALAADINDVQQGTTREGIHLGAMAGTVDLVQRCWTGLGARGDALHLDPRLPGELTELRFPITYRGRSLQVTLTHERLTLWMAQDDGVFSAPITVEAYGRRGSLGPGESFVVDIAGGEVDDG